jgi:hypothetical protein
MIDFFNFGKGVLESHLIEEKYFLLYLKSPYHAGNHDSW